MWLYFMIMWILTVGVFLKHGFGLAAKGGWWLAETLKMMNYLSLWPNVREQIDHVGQAQTSHRNSTLTKGVI